MLLAAFLMATTTLLISSCNNAAPEKETASAVKNTTAAEAAIVTNPNFSIASIEYAELTEKALSHMSKFDFDAWGSMLAENVVYSFPDGDVETRTSLNGKAAVVSWWKNWKSKSGVESMSMSEFNHIPINVTAQPKGGAPMGIYVISYFSNKMVFKGNPVAIRMNFSVHFNANKEIDRYSTYYDRSPIVKAMGGESLLDALKTK